MNPYLLLILLVAVGFGSAFVQRVSGFGLGIFAMLFLPHLMPTVAAATVSCLFSTGTSTYNAIKYRKSISYKAALPMLIAALIVIPIAVHFASDIPERIFRFLLGIILILLSLLFLFVPGLKIKSNLRNGAAAGLLSGALGGLFSTSGPPAVIYLSGAIVDKLVYFATIQFYFSLTNIYATATRAISGLITAKILLYTAVGFIGCIFGDLVGKAVFNRLNGDKFKKVIYIGMILSGILMML